MREIGQLVRLQIQRGPLKLGEKPNRVYDPTALLPVSRLRIDPDGVLGQTPDGAWVVDVHHRAHPRSRNPDGAHGVSVGFTGHYRLMQNRFGAHVALGTAGENLIAESAQVLRPDALGPMLVVLAADGTERVRLRVLQAAEPCRPFTGWALRRRVEPAALGEYLEFLRDGTRGYYLQVEGGGEVAVGDRLMTL